MNLLLDTHIWLRDAPGAVEVELELVTHTVVTDPLNGNLWLSPISIWELMLLVEGKKVTVNEPLDSFSLRSRRRNRPCGRLHLRLGRCREGTPLAPVRDMRDSSGSRFLAATWQNSTT